MSYAIREAHVNERPVLVDFLEKHFFPREHLLSTFLAKNRDKIDEGEERNIREDLRSMHEVMIEHLPCLVAVDQETKEIVGMNLVELERNRRIEESDYLVTDEETLDKLIDELPRKSQLLTDWFINVLEAANLQIDLFELHPHIKLSLKLIILCVNPNHAGKGLSTRLIHEAGEWAKKKYGIEMISGLFTSPFSIRAAEKNGFKIYKQIDILSLKDGEGKFVYEGMKSYVISVMAKLV